MGANITTIVRPLTKAGGLILFIERDRNRTQKERGLMHLIKEGPPGTRPQRQGTRQDVTERLRNAAAPRSAPAAPIERRNGQIVQVV